MAERTLKIVLTGATGQVGSAVLRQLLAHNHSVLLLIRDINPSLPKASAQVKFAHYTLENITDSTLAEVKSFAPDALVHAAWIGTENTNRNQAEFIEANLQSCIRLFEMARQAGCKQFVGYGSQAEYSPNIQADITETSPAVPDNAYGKGKIAACEALAKLGAQQGMAFAWLRIFASYGRDYKASYVMPYLLECYRNGQMPVFKTPHAVWDYIHLEDVATATLAALNTGASGVFNLGTGKGHSIGEIAVMLAEMSGFKDVSGLKAAIQKMDDSPSRRVADISKARKVLHWEPAITLAEGLRGCV